MEIEIVDDEEFAEIEEALANAQSKKRPHNENESQPTNLKNQFSFLPEYLDNDLKIVFVGDNPGLQSSKEKRWYAHATNHFWPLLVDSGNNCLLYFILIGLVSDNLKNSSISKLNEINGILEEMQREEILQHKYKMGFYFFALKK